MNNKKYILIYTGVLYLINLLFTDFTGAQSKSQLIDDYLQKVYNNNQLSGAVLVADSGKIIYANAFGFADLEWKIPNTTDTKFRIASITKQFTAFLVLQMVEEGILNLKDSITKYIHWYPPEKGNKISIHHLLSHTSGLPHYEAFPDFFPEKSRRKYSHEQFVRMISETNLISDPGTKFSYSSFGYYILGYILELLTGKSYGELLNEKILAPLGLNNTTLDDNVTIIEKRAEGYDNYFGVLYNEGFRDMSTALATGDMISTVFDLFLWDQSLYTDTLLSDQYRELLFKPGPGNYAYGWFIDTLSFGNKNVVVNSHSGGTVGFESLIVRYPEDNKTTIVLNNVVPSFIYPISTGLSKILYDELPELPKLSLADRLAQILRYSPVDSAIKEYYSMKNCCIGNYNFELSELNRLGYFLIDQNRLSDAIEIFKLNAQNYPESYQVYESLAEAYLRNNQFNKAYENISKSLELNPGSSSLQEKLNKIAEGKTGSE